MLSFSPSPFIFSKNSLTPSKTFKSPSSKEKATKRTENQQWQIWCESPHGSRRLLNVSQATASACDQCRDRHPTNIADIMKPPPDSFTLAATLTVFYSSKATSRVAKRILLSSGDPQHNQSPLTNPITSTFLSKAEEKIDILSSLQTLPPPSDQSAFFDKIVENIQADDKQSWIRLLDAFDENKSYTTETLITLFEKMQNHHFSNSVLVYHKFFISIKHRSPISADLIVRLKNVFMTMEQKGFIANYKMLHIFYRILLKGNSLSFSRSQDALFTFNLIKKQRNQPSKSMHDKLIEILFHHRYITRRDLSWQEDSSSQEESPPQNTPQILSKNLSFNQSIDAPDSPPTTTRSPRSLKTKTEEPKREDAPPPVKNTQYQIITTQQSYNCFCVIS